MSIVSNIKLALPKVESAKEFLKFAEECSQIIDKSLIGSLMSTLTTIKFNSSHTMHEYLTNIDTKYIFETSTTII